ncbi:Orn/DAP/Arg decarboxylase 2 [Denitrovibrio acetiphilus DSM 12809]|uniref:Diaminopimelate decarboxylase n=1 Tax=Denitrovibrio acetiphilus (strain DSM 12809 / NBRC 114555 / N2460) TaxID=522772 RepID=D4H5F8_DENA2|nr:diaminopimelate decarboxylase [Denitrovibrio acetiphilus]ADD67578.1 Orn/DAP/Arg decarboxylase 2 [Denitrovibrio acetiphilus DSM 12809]
MTEKKVPFSKEQIEEIIKKFPTPFHIYDEKAIVENAKRFKKAFEWAPNFKNYFAVKALPNPAIVKLLKNEGFGADCSSMAELLICDMVGITGDDIMFTSNETPEEEYQKAMEQKAVINLDDITHIDFLEKCAGLPETICFRYNPGPLKGGNDIIGKPEDAKYGLTKTQMIEAYKIMKSKGVKKFGMHTMVASNELNVDYFVETAVILFEMAAEIATEVGINLDFINLGGGIGIPYKPEQDEVNLEELGSKIKAKYDEILSSKGFQPEIYFECGRMITGPYGYLVTKAIHTKSIYKEYIGVDASMANLMRPGMYGSYHHVTVLGKENAEPVFTYDVVGSLCENCDKFAVDRKLPKIEIDDVLAIHDTGAHGHSMGFNYNGKLRSAELLLKADGTAEMIRRAETYEDLFATLKF